MRSRFVRPETKRIDLSNGDWLIVKTRLSAGEARAMYARIYPAAAAEGGLRRLDPLLYGPGLMVAYLVDWNFTDADGKPVAIRGLSVDDLQRVLDSLDPLDFAEVREAITAHDAAMRDEAEREKKTPHGGPPSGSISPSPYAAAGPSSGSAH